MKKIAPILLGLVFIALIIISMPYLIVRDFHSIIGEKITTDDFVGLYIRKEGLYYSEKEAMIKDIDEIHGVFDYFNSFKYYLSSKEQFVVGKDEPYNFKFKNHNNNSILEIFVYNKKDIMIETNRSTKNNYYIKGKREFDFKYFEEVLSRGEEK